MKLPRWLVILMLTTSVLSVLAAAGWWWEFAAERGKVIGPLDRTLLDLETKWVDTLARRRIEETQRQRSEARRQVSEQQRNP